jgi:hypothetical protein
MYAVETKPLLVLKNLFVAVKKNETLDKNRKKNNREGFT